MTTVLHHHNTKTLSFACIVMLVQVGSDIHDKDGDVSEQGSAKRPRGPNHLPDAAAAVPPALDPKKAAAGAGHAYLLQIPHGQKFEQLHLYQPITSRVVGLAVRQTGQQHAANPSAATIAHQEP